MKNLIECYFVDYLKLEIKKMQVLELTETKVLSCNRIKSDRETSLYNILKTFNEAKEHLEQIISFEIEDLEKDLIFKKEKLKTIDSLKEEDLILEV